MIFEILGTLLRCSWSFGHGGWKTHLKFSSQEVDETSPVGWVINLVWEAIWSYEEKVLPWKKDYPTGRTKFDLEQIQFLT